MKKNIEFYPHHAASDQHAKFKMLRVEFGWAGEGKFWALNNRIAQADECCLNVSKKYNKAALASDLDFTLGEFDNFIAFLKNDCELIKECGKGIITTDIIMETFGRVMQDRAEARARYRRASGEEKEASGEETYKGKERKGKKIKDSCPHNEIIQLYHTILVDLPVVKVWSEKRKKILRARWNSGLVTEKGTLVNTLKFWEGFFKYIDGCDFLMGRKNDFRADLEWIATEGNFIKIFEGKYG